MIKHVLPALLTIAIASAAATNLNAADLSLEEILAKWLAATEEIQVFETDFERSTYDQVFRVEKRAVGHFHLDLPNAGRISVRPATMPHSAKNAKTMRQGKVYAVKSDLGEIWEWTSKTCKQTDPKTGQSEEIDLVQHGSGGWFDVSDFCKSRPVVLGVDPIRLQDECDIELKDITTDQIGLTAHARSDSKMAKSVSSIDMLLDASTFLPNAVKLTDRAGHIETVYVYTNVVAVPKSDVQP